MLARVFAHIRQQWLGFIALLLVLTGGTAYASHELINSSDVVNESLLSEDIQNQQVKVNDLALDSVWGSRIKDGGVFPGKLADDVVSKNNVVNDSLTASDINEQAASLVRGYARTNLFALDCTGGAGGNECVLQRAKGITRILRVATGAYCVTAPGIDARKIPAAVSVDWLGSSQPPGRASASISAAADAGGVDCPNDATDYLVVTDRLNLVTVGAADNINTVMVPGEAQFDNSIGFQIVIP